MKIIVRIEEVTMKKPYMFVRKVGERTNADRPIEGYLGLGYVGHVTKINSVAVEAEISWGTVV
jgi:hypothetical protein